MSIKPILFAASLLASAALAGQAHAVSFVNGSFETGDLTGWSGTATTDGYGLNPFGTLYGSGMDGTYWAWLAGYEVGRDISQTVSGLTPGQTYAVRFIIASESSNSDQLNVSVDGGPFTTFSAPPNASGSCCWVDNWASHELDFVATGTSATITFSSFDLNAGGFDVGLDNITISATSTVPEPSTLSLLAGFGLIGIASALRRRRSNRPASLA